MRLGLAGDSNAQLPALHAHRGASHLAPENTMRAFELAVSEGADALELDVRITSDDVPVIFHDDDLARMTTTAGRTASTSWSAFGDLRAGGEPIPGLADLVAFGRQHRLPLNIELKPTARPLALVAACEPILRELLTLVPTMVSSFDPRVLAMLHQRLPTLPLALILEDVRALAALALLPPVDLHVRHDLIDDASLSTFLATPRALRAWTVDDPAVARRLIALDAGRAVSALITNRPGPLRAELLAAQPQDAAP